MSQASFQQLKAYLGQHIIGMNGVVDSLLICLLAEGHALLEGLPGLAKTTVIKTLAEGMEAAFHRIQFTPDLLPSDVMGTDIFIQQTGQFTFRPGPVFHNIVLADEINRAPAKVQSALLEAMAERQVTVGEHSYPLPELFLVLATQNPIEQEGTYPLPEAQLDRFLMHIPVTYPNKQEELAILKLLTAVAKTSTDHYSVMKQADVLQARRQVASLYMDEKIERYIVDLVCATRQPKPYDANLARYVRLGASPRATIGLARAARAAAWLEGAEYVLPRHVQQVAPNILRHRLLLSFEAEADAMTPDRVIARLLEVVAIA